MFSSDATVRSFISAFSQIDKRDKMCEGEATIPQEEEEEEECICAPKEKKKKEVVVKKKLDELATCPYDPRFPNQNQTRRCFVNFIDYQRCTRLLGNYQGCRIFKVCYEALCPNEWIEKWYERMENGTFPVTFPPKDPNMEELDETEAFDPREY